jgi:hypothetical protein
MHAFDNIIHKLEVDGSLLHNAMHLVSIIDINFYIYYYRFHIPHKKMSLIELDTLKICTSWNCLYHIDISLYSSFIESMLKYNNYYIPK